MKVQNRSQIYTLNVINIRAVFTKFPKRDK